MCDRRVIHRCRWMMDDRRRARRARGDADPPRRARRRDRSASFSVAAVARGARGRRRGRRRQRWRAVEGVTDESRLVDASTHAATRRFVRRDVAMGGHGRVTTRRCVNARRDATLRPACRRRSRVRSRRGRRAPARRDATTGEKYAATRSSARGVDDASRPSRCRRRRRGASRVVAREESTSASHDSTPGGASYTTRTGVTILRLCKAY